MIVLLRRLKDQGAGYADCKYLVGIALRYPISGCFAIASALSLRSSSIFEAHPPFAMNPRSIMLASAIFSALEKRGDNEDRVSRCRCDAGLAPSLSRGLRFLGFWGFGV